MLFFDRLYFDVLSKIPVTTVVGASVSSSSSEELLVSSSFVFSTAFSLGLVVSAPSPAALVEALFIFDGEYFTI